MRVSKDGLFYSKLEFSPECLAFPTRHSQLRIIISSPIASETGITRKKIDIPFSADRTLQN